MKSKKTSKLTLASTRQLILDYLLNDKKSYVWQTYLSKYDIPEFVHSYGVIILNPSKDGPRSLVTLNKDTMTYNLVLDYRVVATNLATSLNEMPQSPFGGIATDSLCLIALNAWIEKLPVVNNTLWRLDGTLEEDKQKELYSFIRLPYGVTPVSKITRATIPKPFKDLLDNCSDPEILMQFIGSLFIKGSDRTQNLFLYGPERSGKTTLVNQISKALGGLSKELTMSQLADPNYGLSLLENCRLCAVEDVGVDSSEFIKFKTPSNDRMTVNVKYQNPKTIPLEAKFMFTGRKLPPVGVDNSFYSKNICIRMRGSLSRTRKCSYELNESLAAARSEFIQICIDRYTKAFPKPNAFELNQQNLMGMEIAINEEFTEIVETHFILDPRGFTASKDVKDLITKFYDDKCFSYRNKRNNKDNIVKYYKDFIEFIKTTYNVEEGLKRIKFDQSKTSKKTSVTRGFNGIKIIAKIEEI